MCHFLANNPTFYAYFSLFYGFFFLQILFDHFYTGFAAYYVGTEQCMEYRCQEICREQSNQNKAQTKGLQKASAKLGAGHQLQSRILTGWETE